MVEPYDLKATFMKKAYIIENVIIVHICQKVRSLYESLNVISDRSDSTKTPESLKLADLTEFPIESIFLRRRLLRRALKDLDEESDPHDRVLGIRFKRSVNYC